MAYMSDDDDMNFPRQRFQHPDDADDMDMSSDADSDQEAEEVSTLSARNHLSLPSLFYGYAYFTHTR